MGGTGAPTSQREFEQAQFKERTRKRLSDEVIAAETCQCKRPTPGSRFIGRLQCRRCFQWIQR